MNGDCRRIPDRKNAVIARGGSREIRDEDGKPAKKQVDLKNLLIKGDSTDNFLLEPGDTIVVNQKYFDKFVNAFSRLVGPVFQAAAVYELGDGFIKKD